MGDKRTGRQSAEAAQETKRTILISAAELFCRDGFDRVSLRQISEKAGVSHSLLRHHFGSKLNIWYQISDSLHNDFREFLGQMLAHIDAELPANKRLFLLLTQLLATILVDPRPIQLMADAVRSEQELIDHFLEEDEEVNSLLQGLLDKCQAMGYMQGFAIKEMKWLTVTFAHSAGSMQPILNKTYEKIPEQEKRLVRHWTLYARMFAHELGIDVSEIPEPDSLDELLPDPEVVGEGFIF